ncbi:hypothetical protein Enr13x_71730 [Stieleria neptunia]|uniref:Uncharacterized protein n=1 Tax=Stieleria neptunia TaxID=2527979 RepID=A0A518I2J2_9BACT|nr:hypothetical protein Enr13x_71730 [Stieleria neptunia]
MFEFADLNVKFAKSKMIGHSFPCIMGSEFDHFLGRINGFIVLTKQRTIVPEFTEGIEVYRLRRLPRIEAYAPVGNTP